MSTFRSSSYGLPKQDPTPPSNTEQKGHFLKVGLFLYRALAVLTLNAWPALHGMLVLFAWLHSIALNALHALVTVHLLMAMTGINGGSEGEIKGALM